MNEILINTEYLDVFLDESQEHLQAINDNLLKLEQTPNDLSIVGEVFRSAHTLKGMAATMGFEDLAHLTHNMENVLDLIRNSKLEATSAVLDVVFLAVDDLEAMVTDIATGGEGKRDVSAVVQQLEKIEKGESPTSLEAELEKMVQPEEDANVLLLEESYDEFERTVIDQSFEQGYSAYQIKISIDEKAMLKAARVFMVFDVLEQVGEVIKSTPSAELLEEEKFDQDFLVTVLSKVEGDEIQKRILKVSEITNVVVQPINSSMIAVPVQEKVSEVVEEMPQVDVPVESVEQTKVEEPKTKQKAEMNKTIRVNIERLDVLMNLFEELVIDRGRLEQIASDLRNNELNETVERMSRISGDLQEIILNMS